MAPETSAFTATREAWKLRPVAAAKEEQTEKHLFRLTLRVSMMPDGG
jgi:hypothetical protein